VTGKRPDWWNILVFCLIAGCFSGAVYKIDHNAIDRVARAQFAAEAANAHARANGERIAGVCRSDIAAIEDAHRAIRSGFYLNAQIASDNVNAIHRALKNGQIPLNLHAYYRKALARQERNRAHFRELAAQVKDIAPLC
jgi:hypothetical protein